MLGYCTQYLEALVMFAELQPSYIALEIIWIKLHLLHRNFPQEKQVELKASRQPQDVSECACSLCTAYNHLEAGLFIAT